MNAVRALMISAALLGNVAIGQESMSFGLDTGGDMFSFGGNTQQQEFYSADGKANVTAYKVDESFYIALNGKIAEGYHAYWRNPGSVGMPISATLKAPEGFKVEGPYWEVPHRVAGDFSVAYSYEAPIAVWKVTPEANAPQQAEFTIETEAQTCNDEGCNAPESRTAVITLNSGEPTANSEWAAEETKVELLGDTPIELSATQTKDAVTLLIKGIENIEQAYFFSEDNCINPTAEQKLEKTADGYTLILPRNDNSDMMHPVQNESFVGKELATLKGILSFDGKHAVVSLVLNADAPSVTEAPAVIEEAVTTEEEDEEIDEEEEDEDEEELVDDEEEEDIDEEEEASDEASENATVAPITSNNTPSFLSNDITTTEGGIFGLPGNQSFYSVNGKANVTAYQTGNSFYIALNGKITKGYHAYWRNPGSAGMSVTASLKAPEGFKVEGPYWEVPHRVVGDFSVAYSYEAPIAVWKVTPEATAPQQAEFTIESEAQTCNDTGCNAPESCTAVVTLNSGEPTANPEWTAEETKVELLGDTPVELSATQTKDAVTLLIKGIENIEQAYFFSEDNSIYPATDQKLEKTAEGYTLMLPRNDNNDPMHSVHNEELVGKELSELNGILSFDGKHAVVKYAFTNTTEQTTGEPAVTEQPKEEPATTEQPTEEPAVIDQPTEEPATTEQPTEEPVVIDQPTEEPAVIDHPTEEPAVIDQPTEEPATIDQPKEESTATEQQSDSKKELELYLTTDKESYKKGESFHIALNTNIIKGHHGYWRNPGIAGIPMTATLTAPQGFKVEGPYWTMPQVHDGAYSYENDQAKAVWVVTPQDNAPSNAEFTATCNAQLCNASGCIAPEDYISAPLTLKEGDARTNIDWNGIEKNVEVLGNTEVTVSATQTPEEIILTIKGVEKIENAYFFAEEKHIIDSLAEQKLQKGEDSYTLTLKRQNDDAVPAELKGQTVKQLKGILTFDGKLAGVSVEPEVTAGATPVSPTTTYLYVALLICLGVTLVLTFSNLCGEYKPYVVFALYLVSSLLIALYLQDKMAATPMDFFITLTCYAAAFWALQRWFMGNKTKKSRIISGISALLLVGAFVYTSFPKERPSIWQEWTPEAMAQAFKEGKPVYVDFTATWCATCQTNKKVAYTEEVLEKFKQYNVVLMKADKTNPNPEIDKEMKRLGRSQVPTNVLYVPTEETKNSPEKVHYEITQEIFTADYLSDFITKTMEGQKTESTGKESSSDFWQIIGLLFLGGLILNFMPCVFPVIGIKVMSFVELGGGSRSKIFMHSMAFVAGIVASFFTLSILLLLCFSAEDRSWAVWMQNPWVVYGIVLLLLVLGLSMFGLFEIGVGATGAGQNLQNKEGMMGSFFQGVFITIVATPCSAPFLGSAMPLALALPNVQMVLAFCFMGLGLAFPYIMLGAFPKLIAFLPRPGAWMESLKKGLSFLLFGAAAWILSVYLPMYKGDVALLLLGILIISFAFWVYGKWCPIYQEAKVRRNGAIVAVLMLAVGAWLSLPLNAAAQEQKQPEQKEPVKEEEQTAPTTEVAQTKETSVTEESSEKVETPADDTTTKETPITEESAEKVETPADDTTSEKKAALPEGVKLSAGNTPEWNSWTPTIIEDCLKAGYPVYADFTATWCTNCLKNKKVAYTADTCTVFKDKQVVMVKVDLTDPKAPALSEKDKLNALLASHNRNKQIPINVLYVPSEKEGEQPKLLLAEPKLTPEYLQQFLLENLAK